MTDLKRIQWLHVEATTRCNAHCPACVRNNNGYGIKKSLTIEDLSVDRLREVIELLPNLKSIQLCGNRGDAVSAKNITNIIDLILSYDKIEFIQLQTNGSLKTIEWWRDLAKKMKEVDHNVWFALDGLEDTHHIYRQGTDFKKIIDNASAFIENGGIATWQFIPFEHNQHQLKQCIALSRKLGFKDFKIVKSSRLPEVSRNYLTGEPYDIKPFYLNDKYNSLTLENSKKIVDIKECMHLEKPSLYLGANGMLSICCYLEGINHLNTSIANGIINNKPAPICLHFCGKKK